MDSREKLRRVYIRNAILSFVCTFVCIIIDIRAIVVQHESILTWKMGVSVLLYILLIIMGTRAIKKIKELK